MFAHSRAVHRRWPRYITRVASVFHAPGLQVRPTGRRRTRRCRFVHRGRFARKLGGESSGTSRPHRRARRSALTPAARFAFAWFSPRASWVAPPAWRVDGATCARHYPRPRARVHLALVVGVDARRYPASRRARPTAARLLCRGGCAAVVWVVAYRPVPPCDVVGELGLPSLGCPPARHQRLLWERLVARLAQFRGILA